MASSQEGIRSADENDAAAQPTTSVAALEPSDGQSAFALRVSSLRVQVLELQLKLLILTGWVCLNRFSQCKAFTRK